MADNIASDLRLFRRRVRMTQEEIAAKLGVSRGRYANWEGGTANPPLEFLAKMRELGMTIEHPLIPKAEKPDYGLRTSSDLLALLIDTLYDVEADPDIRARARRELYRVLEIADETKNREIVK